MQRSSHCPSLDERALLPQRTLNSLAVEVFDAGQTVSSAEDMSCACKPQSWLATASMLPAGARRSR
jgi:hypothetical protein